MILFQISLRKPCRYWRAAGMYGFHNITKAVLLGDMGNSVGIIATLVTSEISDFLSTYEKSCRLKRLRHSPSIVYSRRSSAPNSGTKHVQDSIGARWILKEKKRNHVDRARSVHPRNGDGTAGSSHGATKTSSYCHCSRRAGSLVTQRFPPIRTNFVNGSSTRGGNR